MRLFKALNDWLAGKPDIFLKVLLSMLSIGGLLVAWLGSPSLRLFVTAYFLFP